MLDFLIQLDHQLLLKLNGSDSLFMDSVMWSVTHTGTWTFVALALLVFLLRNNPRGRVLLIIVGIVLAILLADQFSSTFCKPYFHRLRPSHQPAFGSAVDIVRGYRGGMYGFISSHAANTFAVATFLCLIVRHRALTFCLLLWASLSSYSRIYLGVHYPADILCGAVSGVLIGWGIYGLYRFACRRIEGTSRPYYSSRYTDTGYQLTDIYCLCIAFYLTYFFVIIKACL